MFWFHLALALGGRTVEEWQRVMSGEEFCYWKAYFKLNPFGSSRDDIRFACLTSDILNYFGANSKPKMFIRKFAKKTAKEKNKEWEKRQRAIRRVFMAYAQAQNEFVSDGKNKHKNAR